MRCTIPLTLDAPYSDDAARHESRHGQAIDQQSSKQIKIIASLPGKYLFTQPRRICWRILLDKVDAAPLEVKSEMPIVDLFKFSVDKFELISKHSFILRDLAKRVGF